MNWRLLPMALLISGGIAVAGWAIHLRLQGGTSVAAATRQSCAGDASHAKAAPARSGITVLLCAEASLRPQGLPARTSREKLPHRWDRAFPGHAGEAEYRITLPAYAADVQVALLFTRVGNQVRASLDGTLLDLHAVGQSGGPGFDAAKAPWMASVPPERPAAGAPRLLTIQTSAQALRGGGLSEVYFGPEADIARAYRTQYLWRVTGPLVYSITLALVGIMALGLWARLRDPLFACFSAAALLGVVRNLDRIWPDVPVPWPLWGAVVNVAYAWHLALMFLFVLMVLALAAVWLRRLLLLYLPCALVLVALSFALGIPGLWTAALSLLMPLGLGVWLAVVRRANRAGPGLVTARIFACAGALALPAGAYDFFVVRQGVGDSAGFALTPLAMFLFVLVMGGVIVDRYVRNAGALLRMNQTLDAKVRAREHELELSHARLRVEQAAHAAAAERQRIMRDLHDGVGAQLVGLQSLLRRADASPELLRTHVEAALDEMRLAVDSMQIVDGDLTMALATLRYRVQPRLEAAELAMHWQVEEIPPLERMTPHTVLQIQRIVLESLTNVLKHAGASEVWVGCSLSADGGWLVLEVGDNGRGFDAACALSGQGLRNMRARAASIGGQLQFSAREGGGSRVQVRWPARS